MGDFRKTIIKTGWIICGILWAGCAMAQQYLVPYPQEVRQGEGKLELAGGIRLPETDPGLEQEYRLAKSILQEKKVPLLDDGVPGPVLRLTLEENTVEGSAEAYRLKIDRDGVVISASSSAGIFYGLQTLRQWGDHALPHVEISDRPAFSWRGFLVDVGRNYQSLDMLREQVEMMARYKLNVFHFHFTEDIAWRLASKKYPGLTGADNMVRWPGKFYTEEEFRELIRFCRERHILFLPEIDMPGHSAAFERYFGVNMQSEAGMEYIKELLTEFRDTYPELSHLHIGGDEVKITNSRFMSEITDFVQKLGYSTVGWDPGSNLKPETLRQLWMGGPTPVEEGGETVYIDSRHLYINHMDPLESVVTIFHRKIGEQDREHANLKGAILCSWPDRAVNHPREMFVQNAVYPAMLAFAERSWRGGGDAGWTARIFPPDSPEYAAFQDFEHRLLHHKKHYFSDLPFPYIRQSDLYWELIGPFANEGEVAREFGVEKNPYDSAWTATEHAVGGTVILRHWWGDIIAGVVEKPEPNTTWYARTKIFCEKDGLYPFWIGFNDLSRSYMTDSPGEGTWDNKGSKVWVNGAEIAPPHWQQAGVKGELEVPLLDEGYTFRAPAQVLLRKGWNQVLVKVPVKDFKGADWRNPVKWMFTFIPLNN